MHALLGVWVGALFVGLILSLMGSGGSLITVPILVYGLHHAQKAAVAEALAIVVGTSCIAVLPFIRRNMVQWKNVGLIGVPAMAGTYAGASGSRMVSGSVQLLLFSILSFTCAYLMLRKPVKTSADDARVQYWWYGIQGFGVGCVSGLVGVGGGFLLIPILVLSAKLEMRAAVGTCLIILIASSGVGVVKYVSILHEHGLGVDWPTILVFTAVASLGTRLGKRLSKHLNQAQLQRSFAIFLVIVSCYVLYRELPELFVQ